MTGLLLAIAAGFAALVLVTFALCSCFVASDADDAHDEAIANLPERGPSPAEIYFAKPEDRAA